MKKAPIFCFFVLCLLFGRPAFAHFGMVIPSDQSVEDQKHANLKFNLMFWHPFENQGMDLAKPQSFKVYSDGKSTDLSGLLKAAQLQGKSIWQASYQVQKPGLYYFVMTPAPYWEGAEGCYIQHITKVAVSAFGGEEGWAAPLGLPMEIVPLAKPYDLYAGNVFRGRVLQDGKPVPGAEVEVEYYPGEKAHGVPLSPTGVTQTVLADDNGVFVYAAPRAGWWGFAALLESPKTLEYKGAQKKVELGAVIWMRFEDMRKPKAMQ